MLILAQESSSLELVRLIPTLPFLSMLVCGLLGCFRSQTVRNASAWVTVAAMSVALLISFNTYQAIADEAASGRTVHFFEWINIGGFSGNFSFYIDTLTIVMLLVVTGVGTLITIYAAWYMAGDPGYFRFFAYISLFIFAMTCLVMADNLLLLYLGWEGVGVASYLLIGFYYRKPSAVAAAKKAFIVNRIGDFGFALGLMGLFFACGSIEYADILPAARQVAAEQSTIEQSTIEQSTIEQPAVEQLAPLRSGALQATDNLRQAETQYAGLIALIPFLLMMGAFGKSAQLPLHVWLPDAMEGPTPVSALIHAATMVTAGVYMIARLVPVFMLSPYALSTVATVGAVTAIFAATIALCQYDIKRIWAYSTVSQLGFMFLGVGCLGTVGAIFHLYTHAFFKALLFLTAGSVMHAMAGQLDLRKMSGLRTKLPITCWLMFAGCLALAGFPFTSGFMSKDMILADALVMHPTLGVVGIVTAWLTAFYTFRLWFRVFWGPTEYEMGNEHHGYPVETAHDHGEHAHGDAHAHPQEPHEPALFSLAQLPLVILAVGALLGGACGGWMTEMIEASTAQVSQSQRVEALYGPNAVAESDEQLTQAYTAAHDQAHHLAMGLSIVGSLGMIGLAWLFHFKRRDLAEQVVLRFADVVTLLNNKYYIDELYDWLIRLPLRVGAWICAMIDEYVVDRFIVDTVFGRTPRAMAAMIRGLQRGALQSYALSMGVGVVIVLLLVAWKVMAR